MNNKSTKKELLKELFTSFETGIRSSKAQKPKDYLQSIGLDYEKLNLGFNSGQFHHRKESEFKKQFAEIGILTHNPKVNVNSKDREPYTCFGSYSIVYPLKNELGEIVNLYADRFKLENPVREYLYTSEGIYPNYPKATTKRLYLCVDVIETASFIQSDILDNREQALALFDGELSTEIKEAILSLEELEEIIYFSNTTDTAVVDYLNEKLPQTVITQIEIPGGESLNEFCNNYDLEALQSLLTESNNTEYNPELVFINPQKISFKGIQANYDIVGSLSIEFANMKVALHINEFKTNKKFRHHLNLFDSKQVTQFCIDFSEKHGYNANLIEVDLYQLTNLLEQYRDELFEQETNDKYLKKYKQELTPRAEELAIEFLTESYLVNRIDKLIEKTGIVGEQASRMNLFAIASSYKSNYPLHGLIQAFSGEGKSHLLNGIANLMPQEEVMNLSRITSKSLYNYSTHDLVNKLIVVQDWSGLDEEAQFAFRELQSAGFLNSSTTTKNKFGQLESSVRKIEAHFSSLIATTQANVYHDNMTRSVLVGLDESEEQTDRIIEVQNQQFNGKSNKEEQEKAKQLLRNCMRMLKKKEIINPYSENIKLPNVPNKRRLNVQFNSLIFQITFLNQYQRKEDKQGRLITTKEDIKTAINLFFPSLILKIDELDSSNRQLFEKLKTYLGTQPKGLQSTFKRKEVTQYLNLKNNQSNNFVKYLVKLEYLKVVSGSSNIGFTYQIAEEDEMHKVKKSIQSDLYSQLDKL